MNHPASSDVVVVGAGLAGLAAAIALSAAGASVTLVERKPHIGGRAYSYPHPALDEVVDSQHLLLGCCTNLLDLCRLAGADGHIRWYDRIPFLEPGTDGRPTRRSDLGAGSLPAPAHSVLSFLTAAMLSTADKARVGAGLAQFLRGYPAADEQPFSEWLRLNRQTDAAIRHFWEPIVLATLNDSLDRCSTRYAGKVFHESFLKSPAGGRMGIPTQPLSEFYAALATLAEAQGTRLHLRTGIHSLEQQQDGSWSAIGADGTVFNGRSVVLALPFEATAALLATLPPDPELRAVSRGLTHFRHAPITTIHLWFDRSVTDIEQAGLLDTRIQWLFNKSAIRRHDPAVQPGGHGDSIQYLELTISGSFAELEQSREGILRPALEELASFFPAVRDAQLIKSGVLKEARATFSVTPGLDRFRPLADALGHGLYLAGDWTRTDWPSTMEGAVRSGRLAAEALLAQGGQSGRVLVPELPPSGLMKLLA